MAMKNVAKVMLRAGLAALALGMAGTAEATQYLIVAQGTLFNATNNTNDFGLTGVNSLNGQAFTLEYILTDPGGELIGDGINFRGTQGGTPNPLSNGPFVPLAGKLTINGLSMIINSASRASTPTYSGSRYSGATIINNGTVDSLFYTVEDSDINQNFIKYITFLVYDPSAQMLSDTDYTASRTINVAPYANTLSADNVLYNSNNGIFIYRDCAGSICVHTSLHSLPCLNPPHGR
jgi:hypothetical protein